LRFVFGSPRPRVLFPLPLGVGDRHDGVVPKDDAARGVVADLTRNGIELHLHGIARDAPQVDRKEIEEERPVASRVQGDEAVLPLRIREAVDLNEVRRLSAESRTVVDDLRGEDLL
jgi:hypothetical protein